MRNGSPDKKRGRLKLTLASVAAVCAAAPIALTALSAPAYADYTPAPTDVVGVGSDTLQYMLDFMADGFPSGTTGWDTGKFFKMVSFDATADANARLAYGPFGQNASNGACTPGTGHTGAGSNGTVNMTSPLTAITGPCVLNPTISIRAGYSPTQRPNGSGDGFAALLGDIQAGHSGDFGTSSGEIINFSRASAPKNKCFTGTIDGFQQTTLPAACNGQEIDSVTLGVDPLAMLYQVGGHFVSLSANELNDIYGASPSTANNNADGLLPGNGSGAPTQAGCVTWGEVGVTGPAASDTIIAVLPQVGSGTRSVFLGSQTAPANQTSAPINPGGGISTTTSALSPGLCTENFEENDPTAIFQATCIPAQTVSGTTFTPICGATGTTTGAGTALDPADVIEPISGGRLSLFQGTKPAWSGANTTTASPNGWGNYFVDPSCLLGTAASAGAFGSAPNCQPSMGTVTAIDGSASQVTSGTPITSVTVGSLPFSLQANQVIVLSTGGATPTTLPLTVASSVTSGSNVTITVNSVNSNGTYTPGSPTAISGPYNNEANVPKNVNIQAVVPNVAQLTVNTTPGNGDNTQINGNCTTGTVPAVPLGCTAADNNPAYEYARPLYTYFRHSDIGFTWTAADINGGTAPVSSGTTINNVTVAALPVPLSAGQTLVLSTGGSPASTQNLTVTAAVSAGSNVVINVNPVSALNTYTPGTATVSNINPWESGQKLNWLRQLFYNPCDGAIAGNCFSNNTYGPGNAPWAAANGQQDIWDAGVIPDYQINLVAP